MRGNATKTELKLVIELPRCLFFKTFIPNVQQFKWLRCEIKITEQWIGNGNALYYGTISRDVKDAVLMNVQHLV